MPDMFYSNGQNTADIKTGSPTISISSGTATFSVAQTGDIVVGDEVTYNTTSKCYLVGKTSTTIWAVRTATGGTPGDVSGQTVNSIKRAFNSLNAAISGASPGAANATHLNTKGLVAATITLHIACCADEIDIKTGTPTVSISSGTATFSTGQTAAKVGGLVTYNTTSKMRLVAKTSDTVWTVKVETAGNPADVSGQTVNSIFNYDNTWGNSIDSSWVTSSTYRINIFTPTNTATQCNNRQRHLGKFGSGYMLVGGSSSGTGIGVGEPNVTIDGLLIDGNPCRYYTYSSEYGITMASFTGTVIIKNNVIKNIYYRRQIVYSYENFGFSIYNNILIDNNTGNSEGGVWGLFEAEDCYATNPEGKIYNNTLYVTRDSLPAWREDSQEASNYRIVMKRNNVILSTASTQVTFQDAGVTWSTDYLRNASGYNCVSNAIDFRGYTGTGSLQSKTNTDTKFTSITDQVEDFLPTTGSCLIGAGIGPSSDADVPTEDILGNTRSGATCTIGAFEVAAATGLTKQSDNYFRQRVSIP